MADNTTYASAYDRVRLRCPSAPPTLARDWVRNAFLRIGERRPWSWLIKYNQFLVPAAYVTGTVSAVRGSTIITGSGVTWTPDMVGRQIRISTAVPIYTITSVDSSTQLQIELPYGGTTVSNIGYQIYQCYFTPPADFHNFISVWDPRMNWQLWLNVQQKELNVWDPQRATTGQAFAVASLDYTANRTGIVNPALQVLGSGNSPTSTGSYTGPNDAIFTIECTLGGAVGVATFRWKKDSGSYTSGVVTSATAQDLQDNTQIYWPSTPITLGDIWVVSCLAGQSAGIPRYEIWPYQQAEYVYPYLYISRAVDLEDPNAVIPRYIRTDVLIEMALTEAARWPGPSTDKPNPYFNSQVALQHERRSEQMIMEMERQDDEVYEQDLTMQYPQMGWPFSTPFGDSRWLQSHAI